VASSAEPTRPQVLATKPWPATPEAMALLAAEFPKMKMAEVTALAEEELGKARADLAGLEHGVHPHRGFDRGAGAPDVEVGDHCRT
jgi:hypothetical protein